MIDFEKLWSYESTKVAFDNLDIGVHIIDENGITILYNSACQTMDGIDEVDVLGKNLKDLVRQGIFSKSVGLEALEKGEMMADSQVVNGKIIFTTSFPIFNRDGSIKFVLTSCMDISK